MVESSNQSKMTMRGSNVKTGSHTSPPLYTVEVMRRTGLNRAFALIYTFGILALLYRHFLTIILHSTSFISLCLSMSLLIADTMLAFMWATTQSLRMRPIRRRELLENLTRVVNEREFVGLDVFICTADPFKEPPMSAVNTALSVLAYDYPTEKLSIYLSDDGASQLTLFAFMEAAKFAIHWLPFCRDYGIQQRCPDAYFKSTAHHRCINETDKMKRMYEIMKAKVERVMERGCVDDEYIMNEEREAFDKWTAGFTRQDHPTVIQVLLESRKDKDVTGHGMPNLVYVSREKSKTSTHHYKAGALNVLLRVSATMTNAAVVLTLDCDTFSNAPETPRRVLCYLSDPVIGPNIAYVQFPQRFHGIDENDIYGNEHKRLYQIDPAGMDGLAGTRYVGSGCFFRRRAFFGGPSSLLSSEIPELNQKHAVVDKSISSKSVLTSAYHVASCNYEHGTNWGIEIGFRYGSLTEDYNTSYRQQCLGWNSVFCHPDRAAFLGETPFNLNDVLSQNIRWSVGLLEVAFSKYSPVSFGIRAMGLLMGLAYAHNGYEATWSIPISIYSVVPQLALLNQVSLFPKVSDPWFYLYTFLFLGAYGQDFLEFILAGATIQRWWNDQRMWMIRGVSSYLFGVTNVLLKSFAFSGSGFNVTSKMAVGEERKRYEQGKFEFGVPSPMFVPLATTAILNLTAFVWGLAGVFRHGNRGEVLFVQLFISGYAMVNCWPIYEAIVLRKDGGKMPGKITLVSILLVWALCVAASLALKH